MITFENSILILIIILSLVGCLTDIKSLTVPLILQGILFFLCLAYQVKFQAFYQMNLLINLIAFILYLKTKIGGADKKLIPIHGFLIPTFGLIIYYSFLSVCFLFYTGFKKYKAITKPLPFYPAIVVSCFLAKLLAYIVMEM